MGKAIDDEVLLAFAKKGGGGGGGYTLPTATASRLGGVKIGSGINVEEDGTISASGSYVLPTATAERLGGVKIGSGLSVEEDGTISASGGSSLTAGDYISIEDNVISVDRIVSDVTISYEVKSKDTSGASPTITVIKMVDGVVVSSTDYTRTDAESEPDHKIVLDDILWVGFNVTGAQYNNMWSYGLLIASDTHDAGYRIDWVFNANVDYTEIFEIDNSSKDLMTKGDLDYADLPNKPSINGNELSGNKTGAQLGLQNALTFDDVPTANSNNPVKSGGVYAADEAIRQWTTAEAKSVSGNPITLTDGSARNAEGLAVTLEPIQDLHGYDKPWAGGAGKNKLPLVLADIKSANTSGTWSGNVYTLDDMTFTVETDADGNVTGINLNGTSSVDWVRFTVASYTQKAGSYIVNGVTGGADATYRMEITGKSGTITNGDYSYTINEDTATQCYIVIRTSGTVCNNVKIYPMVRLSTVSDATFAPYTNECSITGLTECVADTLPNASYIPYFEGVKNGTHGFVDLKTLEWVYNTTQTNHVFVAWSNPTAKATTAALTKKYSPYTERAITGASTASLNMPNKSIAIGSSGWNGGIVIRDDSITTLEDFIRAMDGEYLIYELETAATPSYTIQQWTDLVNSFNGNDAVITFGQTVYGGSVDFKSGKVLVTHKLVTVDNVSKLTNFATSADYGAYAKVSDTTDCKVDSNAVLGLCSKAIYVSHNNRLNTKEYNRVWSDTSNTSVFVRASYTAEVSSVNDLYDIFENAQIAYELATPTELTLTPAELELLKGYNYITSNGVTISLDYLPNSLLAEAENYTDEVVERAGMHVLTGTTMAELLTAIGNLTEAQKLTATIKAVTQYATIPILRISTLSTSSLATNWTSALIVANTGTFQYKLDTNDGSFVQVQDNSATTIALTLTSWTLLYFG